MLLQGIYRNLHGICAFPLTEGKGRVNLYKRVMSGTRPGPGKRPHTRKSSRVSTLTLRQSGRQVFIVRNIAVSFCVL